MYLLFCYIVLNTNNICNFESVDICSVFLRQFDTPETEFPELGDKLDDIFRDSVTVAIFCSSGILKCVPERWVWFYSNFSKNKENIRVEYHTCN